MYPSQALSYTAERPLCSSVPLRRPEPADSLGNTDIICLKRVQRNAHEDGCCTQRPHSRGTDTGHAVLGEVVDDARLEADVRVDDEQSAEDRVGNGVQGTSGEGGECEGNQAGGDDSEAV